MKRISILVITSLMISACAGITSTPREKPEVLSTEQVFEMYQELPEAYRIPGLEPLDRISEFRFNGFKSIDDRALILDAGASRKYLVILNDESQLNRFTREIYLDRESTVIRVGFNKLAGERIQAIFQLDGHEGASAARRYISDRNAELHP